ncbi:Fc.00g072830.m01.CDS01, partial [Cosmosporella sp. VM-42]
MSLLAHKESLPFELADKSLAQFDCQANGQSALAKSGQRFNVVNPSSGEVWASCPDCTGVDIDHAVQSSHDTFKVSSTWTPTERAQCLSRWHNLIVDARDDLAKILVYEAGK